MARSSHALLCWRRAVSMARRKQLFGGGTLVGRLGQQQLALEAVQLGLVATVVVLLGNRQPFVERRVRVLEPPGLRVGIAQHAEVGRDADFRPGGPEGTQAP